MASAAGAFDVFHLASPDPVGLRRVLRPLRGRAEQGLHVAGAGLDAAVDLALGGGGQRNGRGLHDELEHHRAAGTELMRHVFC